MHNYYVFQTNKDIPAPMPHQNGFLNTYRKEHGTSIAVRVNPNNDLPDFDLSKILDKILFNPEVRVNLAGKGERGRYIRGLDLDNTEVIKHKFSEDDMRKLKKFTRGTNIKNIDPEIQIIPINLNRNFSHPHIKGFVYFFLLKSNIEYNRQKYNYYNNTIRGGLTYRKYSEKPTLKYHIENKTLYSNDDSSEFEIDLSNLLEPIELFNGPTNLKNLFDLIVLSHNGIIIPNKRNQAIEFSSSYHTNLLILGYIELFDKLRPNLSLSRSEITSVTWLLWSSLNYSIRRNIPENYSDLRKINYFRWNRKIDFNYKELNEDNLILNKEYWPSEKIFLNNKYSLIDILDSKVTFNKVLHRDDDEEYILKTKLIELYAKYKIILLKERNEDKYTLVKEASLKKIKNHSKLIKPDYPPLTFCEYENFDGLMPEELNDQIFNINHPFSKWLIKSYIYLEKNYSNHLYILMNKTDISVINTTINKLREHLPEQFRPSLEIHLTDDDFKIDFDTIPLKSKLE